MKLAQVHAMVHNFRVLMSFGALEAFGSIQRICRGRENRFLTLPDALDRTLVPNE